MVNVQTGWPGREQALRIPVPCRSPMTSRRCARQRQHQAAVGSTSIVHRYYTPKVGQFLSVDPTVLKTVQAYGYANDDPVNESDPTGDCGCVARDLAEVSAVADVLALFGGLASLALGPVGLPLAIASAYIGVVVGATAGAFSCRLGDKAGCVSSAIGLAVGGVSIAGAVTEPVSAALVGGGIVGGEGGLAFDTAEAFATKC